MARLRYNGMATGSAGSQTDISLSGSHTNSTTTLNFNAALTYANGTAVPTLSGGDYFMLSILDAGGRVAEVVRVTAYTSGATSATVTRGQEGYAGVAHASGAKVVHGPTARDGLIHSGSARRTSGNIAYNSTSYGDVDTGLDIVLNAAVGDTIEASLAATFSAGAVTFCVLDVVTVVSGSPVNSFTTGGAPSTTASGGSWGVANTTRGTIAGSRLYVVQSGDLSSGTVRLRLRVRSGNISILAAGDPDLYWLAKNLGPQPAVA